MKLHTTNSTTPFRCPNAAADSGGIWRRTVAFLAMMLAFASGPAARGEPFANDFAPTFSFADNYIEKVFADQSDDTWTVYSAVPNEATSKVQINAHVSAQGIDLAALDRDTPFSVQVGDFNLDVVLGDDPAYAPGATAAHVPLYGWDEVTEEEIEIGYAALSWAGGAIDALIVTHATPTFSIAALSYAGAEDDAIRDVLAVSLAFADRELEGRTVYFSGTATVTTHSVGSGDNADEVDLASVRLSGAIDSVAPKVTITSPASGGIVTSPSTSITGTASDQNAVTAVRVALNGGAFATATLDAQGWRLEDVTLPPGENSVAVVAEDADQNISAPVTRIFQYLTPLTVSISGGGSVTRGFLGTTMRVPGAALSIKATPASGQLFSHWSGSIASDAPLIAFTVAPGMSLEAHFIYNPFPSVHGTYTGLLTGSRPGAFSATIGSTGAFTGKLLLDGATVAFSGAFNPAGRFSGTVARPGGGTFAIALQLDVTGGTDSISGTLSDGVETWSIGGDRDIFNTTNPAPQAGTYTVLLPAPGGGSGQPEGDGYATLKVSASGTVTFSGALGDGTPLSGSAALSKSGTLPLYVALYGDAGWLAGTVTFRDVSGVSDLDGALSWAKPVRPLDAVYPGGFRLDTALVGATYQAPAPGVRALAFAAGSPNGEVAIGGGQLASGFVKTVTLAAANTVVITAPDFHRLVMTLSPASGTMSGSFYETATGAKRTFKGVLLQKQNRGSGWFRSGARTGYVTLSAR